MSLPNYQTFQHLPTGDLYWQGRPRRRNLKPNKTWNDYIPFITLIIIFGAVRGDGSLSRLDFILISLYVLITIRQTDRQVLDGAGRRDPCKDREQRLAKIRIGQIWICLLSSNLWSPDYSFNFIVTLGWIICKAGEYWVGLTGLLLNPLFEGHFHIWSDWLGLKVLWK